MSVEVLRNVKDGSMREVETNSDEYVELINEVYDHEGSARPKWEITGRHHMQRLDNDDHTEADFGYEDKPIPPVLADFETIGPELHPERALTQGEVEMGIESHDQKMESVNAARASLGALGQTIGKPVEPLERTAPEERHESGPSKVGRKSSRRSKTADAGDADDTSGSGSSGSGSGGAAPAAGSGSTGSTPAPASGAGSSGSAAQKPAGS